MPLLVYFPALDYQLQRLVAHAVAWLSLVPACWPTPSSLYSSCCSLTNRLVYASFTHPPVTPSAPSLYSDDGWATLCTAHTKCHGCRGPRCESALRGRTLGWLQGECFRIRVCQGVCVCVCLGVFGCAVGWRRVINRAYNGVSSWRHCLKSILWIAHTHTGTKTVDVCVCVCWIDSHR